MTLPLNAAMIETFALLLLAHTLADFLLQTDWMVARKRRPQIFALHIGIVGALSVVALGGAWQAALAVTAAHLIIDAVKIWALPPDWRNTLSAFLTDQLLHLVSIAGVALLWPLTVWGPEVTQFALTLSGLIISVFAGGYAIGLMTARFDHQPAGLPEAGRIIGQLERALIFMFVWIGEPTGIGFLIAAKSVLRFDTAKEDRVASEYVIVGTLASFAWALAGAYITLELLEIAAKAP